MDTLLRNMSNASVFSKIDLTSGFWQLPLDPRSRDYTTFRVDGKAWRFTVVPFGWCGAPAAFQATIDSILQEGVSKGFLSLYMDDILVHSKNMQDYIAHLHWTLGMLAQAGLVLNHEKCIFGSSEVPFLGHTISASGIHPQPDKLEIIANLQPPRNQSELRSLLGTLGFYQNFIPRYADLVRPMSLLLSKGTPFRWQEEQMKALESIKHAFSNVNPLDYITPDTTMKFILSTDASAQALGAQLRRMGKDQGTSIVTNVSRALTDTESRYSNTERELLSIVWGALHRLELLTAGFPILIETDHAALISILTGSPSKESTPLVERLRAKLTRWIGTGLSIQHIQGKSNKADALSRPHARQTRRPRAQVPPAALPSQVGEGRPAKIFSRSHTKRKPTLRATPITLDESYHDIDDPDTDDKPFDLPDHVLPEPEEDEVNPPQSLCLLRLTDIQKAQMGDDECAAIRMWLEKKRGPEPFPRASEYVLFNNLITHPRQDARMHATVHRPLIPGPLRDQALACAHTSGHIAYGNTMLNLEGIAFWPGYSRDAAKFIEQCAICAQRCRKPPMDTLGESPIQPHPWHTVGMDLLQLPEASKGHKYLLVLVDLLTRFAVAIPLLDKSGNQVCRALRTHMLNHHLLGPPASSPH